MSKLGEIAKKVTWGVAKRLPVISAFDFSRRYQEELDKDVDNARVKATFHSVYAAFAVGMTALYGWCVIGTGSWNPSTQGNIIEQRALEREKTRDVWDDLFGNNGVADYDSNGIITESDIARGYEDMGIGIHVSPENRPSLEQLQNLRDKYQGGNRE